MTSPKTGKDGHWKREELGVEECVQKESVLSPFTFTIVIEALYSEFRGRCCMLFT